MKIIKYPSILAIILSFSFSAFQNPETGWEFDQSTSQAFYMFETIEICEDINNDGDHNDEGECNIVVGDGCAAQECSTCYCCENFNSCDVIGAFFDYHNTPNNVTDDICVGWVYADSGGWTTVPINGNDGGEYSEDYPSVGDQVRFVIYDASQSSLNMDNISDPCGQDAAEGICMDIDLNAMCNPSLNGGSVPADCSFANFGMFLYGENDYTLNNDIAEIPDEFQLLSVYPNPFNPSLNIDFSIETYAKINISIYDLLGNLIETLIYNDMYVVGNHSIHWEPNNISSGEYLISLTVNDNFIKTEKVIYLK